MFYYLTITSDPRYLSSRPNKRALHTYKSEVPQTPASRVCSLRNSLLTWAPCSVLETRLGILLEEENKRLRDELEAMRRLLLMCVACVRGVREWSRCSPLHPAAPLRAAPATKRRRSTGRSPALPYCPLPRARLTPPPH